jgi:hypothetical protein
VVRAITSALRDRNITVPANLLLNCQHESFVIKGSIVTPAVDEKCLGSIDAAMDAAWPLLELKYNDLGVGSQAQRKSPSPRSTRRDNLQLSDAA